MTSSQNLILWALLNKTLATNAVGRVWLITWIFLFMGVACPISLALDSPQKIEQFTHTAWGHKEGAPQNIFSITQTKDGYLWLATTEGLFRFDGITFEHYEPPSGPTLPSGGAQALLALPNGDLWIGFAGAISLLRNGKVENYASRDGVPEGLVTSLVQDWRGTIWAGTPTGLARFENNRWKKIGKEWNFSGKSAWALHVDGKGTLWVAESDESIVFLPRGATAFQSTSVHVGTVCQIDEAPNGKLWMAETTRSVRPVPLGVKLSPSDKVEVRVGSEGILFSREGGLWISTIGDGIRYIPVPEQLRGKPGRFSSTVESFTMKDGLTDDYVASVFQDHEGNIWAGTRSGLDRFRMGGLVPFALPSWRLGQILIPGNSGDLWAFTAERIFHIRKSRMNEMKPNEHEMFTAYRDSGGVTWLISGGGLFRFENGSFSRFPLPKELPVPFSDTVTATADGSGALWIAVQGKGLFRREKGIWSRFDDPELSKLDPTTAFTDDLGRAWFGYSEGAIIYLEGGKLQTVSSRQDFSRDAVNIIQGRNKHIWVGRNSGLFLFDGGEFHKVVPVDRATFDQVVAIEELGDGDLWLFERHGLVHISSLEVRKFLDSPSYRVHYEIFDSLNSPPAIFQNSGPRLAEGSDGRLWFAADRSLAWLNPSTIPASIPPPISIRSITAAGRQFALQPDLTIPPRSGNLRVEYTAVNLSAPEQVRYRYKLDNVDRDWQDAGVRHEAFYTNLGPGKYRFHANARNEGGDWNIEEAMLDLTIAPAWFQTIWFQAFCGCIFLFLLWVLYQLRMRQLERRFLGTLEARLAERTRIARELHDTLLQTFSASLLRFQSAVKMLPARPEEARQRGENAIEQASNAIAEGRDAVQELRSEGPAGNDFARAIGNFGKELLSGLANENPPEFRVHVGGTPRKLNPMVRDEAYRIAVEALRNAMRHAEAKQLEAEVQYDVEQWRLRIRDDGKGIDPSVLEQGPTAGHWGLRGMRERAKLLRGNFEIWSKVGSGTEVELTVPAAKAYTKASSRFPAFLKKWRSICCCAWLIIFAMASGTPARALETGPTITQFIHTSWGAKEGAPVNIKAMAQTTDGYLWIGVNDGLFRFDGTVFEHYEPQAGPALPGGMVTALLGLPNGDLCIGYYSGAITLLRNGRAQNYSKREGVPDGHLWGFAQDRQGTIWAGTNAGLARFEGDRWKQVGKEWNFTWRSAKVVFVDHKGTLWVAADNAIVFLPEGARTFQSTSAQVGQTLQFAEAANGKLWMAETSRSVRPIPLGDTLSPSDETEVRVGARSILFDREGRLWIPTLGDGIRRVSTPEQLKGKPGRSSSTVEQFMKKDGLSDDTAVTILQDRDGNIWVGTMGGIDRFRRSSLVPAGLPFNNVSPVLVPGNSGDIWSFQVEKVFHIDQSRADEVKKLLYPIHAACRDSKGGMWLITSGNLVRFENGRFYLLPLPKELPTPVILRIKIAEDRSGALWLAADEWGLFRYENGRWSRVETPPDVAKLLPAAAFTDELGHVWFGYVGGVVVALDEGKLQVLRLQQSSPSSDIYAIQGRNKHLWVGTTSDLLFFDGSQFHVVAPEDQPRFLDVAGTKELADGSLWLCEKRGIIHIDAAEVRKFLEMPSHRVHYEVFDSLDGVQGTFLHLGEKLIEATDHHLWFASSKNIAWLDPAVPRNFKPLSNLIKYVHADGQQFPLDSDLSLPPRIGNLQIGYTAVDLSVPERVHYRYRLDGMDKDWQDVGIRRDAFYTNLGPGKYKFHMSARHEGEEWSTEAVLDFRVAPAWFQTIWFRAFCVCVFLFLLWTLYQLRLRQLERQFSRTLEARVAERTRIARELHDTLLQTFSASLLRFQSVSKMLPTRPEDAKQRVDIAIEQASNAIAEGRDAVHELRSEEPADDDLAQAIGQSGREFLSGLANENPPEFRVHLEGTPRKLNPMVRDEAYRIAAEALRNAIRHAEAKQIEAEVQYDAQQLRLRIRDDGKGIDPVVLEQGHVPGHWGLRGMRERAKLLDGEFAVWSEVGSGTEVELTVPAASAYFKPASRWSIFLKGWRS